MITFKQYLLEAIRKPWKVTAISLDDVVDMARARCKKAVAAGKAGKLLFRGFGDRRGFGEQHQDSALIVDTTGSVRTSADTNNAYQSMMEIHPALNTFPPRTSSLICSTNYSSAEEYGSPESVYIVLPYDNVGELAISDDADFLGTKIPNSIYRKDAKLKDLFSVSVKFDHLIDDMQLPTKTFMGDEDSINNILHDVNPLQLFFELDYTFSGTGVLYTQGGKFNELYQTYKKTGQKDFKMLTIEDLSTVGKKLYKIYQLNPLEALSVYIFGDNPNIMKMGHILDTSKANEVWFEGKAILINMTQVPSIRKDLFEID